MGVDVSVVVNTLDRVDSLEMTLRGLRTQTYDRLEVVVVNGPSTDGTDELLSRWGSGLQVVHCADAHLGRSRNLGIRATAGEVVAFIDDDAVPAPTWVERLAAAYDDEPVAGAGGFVIDRLGDRFQYRYSVADRSGAARFDVEPPLDSYVLPGADPFLYLQGTNCSFRRSALEAVGGFDEEIEYFLDETDLCMRLIDAGHRLVMVPDAVVHHRYGDPAVRPLYRDPYAVIKNRWYFAVRNLRDEPDRLRLALGELSGWSDDLIAGAVAAEQAGVLAGGQSEMFRRRVGDGVGTGLRAGLAEREPPVLEPGTSTAFVPFARSGWGSAIAVVVDRTKSGDDAAPVPEGDHVRFVLRPGTASSAATPSARGDDLVWNCDVATIDRPVTFVADASVRSELIEEAAVLQELIRLAHQMGLGHVDDRRSPARWPLAELVADEPSRRSSHVAALVAEQLHCGDDQASQIAAELLDDAAFPVPIRTLVGHLLAAPDDSFVDEAFALLASRAPSPAEAELYVPRLAVAGGRAQIIRNIVTSSAAESRYGDTTWTASLEDAERDARTSRLRTAIELPADRFLSEVYRAVLRREPDDDGRAHFLRLLAAGTTRTEVVATVVSSDEAAALGVDAAVVLEELGWRLPPAPPQPSRVVRLALGLVRRVRARVSALRTR